jgi:hypothetical protein
MKIRSYLLRTAAALAPPEEGAGAGQGGGQQSQGVTGAHPAAQGQGQGQGSGASTQDGASGAGTGTGEGSGQDGGASSGNGTGANGQGQGTGQGQPAGQGQGQGDGEGLLATAHQGQGQGDGQQQGEGGDDGTKDTPQQGKPEGLPDQFWDPDNQQVRTDSLVKAWKDTRDELRQVQQRQESKPPEKPDDYQLSAPQDLPRQVDENDPGRQAFAKVAHKHGLTQEQAQGVFQDFLGELHESGAMPEPISIEQEKQKLGKHADAIISSTYRWGQQLMETGVIGQDEFDELIILGSTAEGLRALNKIRQHYTGEQPIPTDTNAVSGLPSKQELYDMVADPRYGQDSKFTQYVTEMFQKVMGDAPAGSSQPGLGVPRGQGFTYPTRGGQSNSAGGS